ncbi:hypothetical protein Pcinc_036566, partial [Petrolisthes cinctipes]
MWDAVGNCGGWESKCGAKTWDAMGECKGWESEMGPRGEMLW